MLALSPAPIPQNNKAMCLSCTWQFSSVMPLLSEREAKCLLGILWGETSRESVRHNFEFSSIWDGAQNDPRPQRAFLGLSLILFGIKDAPGALEKLEKPGGLPGCSEHPRKLCYFIFLKHCRRSSQAYEWSVNSRLCPFGKAEIFEPSLKTEDSESRNRKALICEGTSHKSPLSEWETLGINNTELSSSNSCCFV